MAATKLENAYAIQVPDTLASEAIDGGIQDLLAKEPPLARCCMALLCLVFALLVASFVVTIIVAVLDRGGGPTEYSAAITGAAVPNNKQAPDAIPALFELTVHIKNPSRLSEYCVWSDATAVASCGGATIGAGTVPWFCAGKRGESEVAVPVWGVGAGADVTLPRALQGRGAVVDVEIRAERNQTCDVDSGRQVLTCSVKVGGGLSLCSSSCDYNDY